MVGPSAGRSRSRSNAQLSMMRVQVARLVDHGRERLGVGRRPGFGAEAGQGLVDVDRVGRQQLRPGPLLRPVLAHAQLPSVVECERFAVDDARNRLRWTWFQLTGLLRHGRKASCEREQSAHGNASAPAEARTPSSIGLAAPHAFGPPARLIRSGPLFCAEPDVQIST